MKGKLLTVCTLCLLPMVILGITGCDKEIAENSGYVLQDTLVYPTVEAPYEEESKAALNTYLSVASKHTTNGEVDGDNSEVMQAAKTAAAQLYAYACYNEEYIDKYVYFSNQSGSTDLGSMGSSEATKQDYKLIIHEGDDTCGYKYHYTIKKVDEASGSVSNFRSSFESCKLRFVTDTDTLYRFKGDDYYYVTYDNIDYLTCTWKKDSSDWGTQDNPVQKREGDKLTIDEIAEDIVATAEDDPSDAVVHGNINILADDIINYAYIYEYTPEGCEETLYMVLMGIDTDVANSDEASLAMLRESNSSSNCTWVGSYDDTYKANIGPFIILQLWDNGLFYSYTISEEWSGKILTFSGEVNSTTTVTYSYSDRDTDMTDKNAMLASALSDD